MTSVKLHRLGPVAGMLAALTACPECFPEEVGEGVARLTVRNVGAMLTLLNADQNCGFQSPEVLQGAVVEGQPGGPGSVTFTVTDCTIDLGEGDLEESDGGRLIAEDCNGVVRRGVGSFTASATRTVEGTVTGDPQNPILPDRPDALTIRITESSFNNFEVSRSDNEDERLRIEEGSLTAVAKPLLAASASSGACAISTPNVSFSDIVYGPSTVFVTTDSQDFDADVDTSNITAQNGRFGNEENTISGTMTVFGDDVDVTGDEVLDDLYERENFVEGYSCLEDISQPPSFECVTFEERLSTGSARLGVQAIGVLANALDDDTTCGFSSPQALQGATLRGTPGTEGSLTIRVTDCQLDFTGANNQGVTLPADCAGESTTLNGRALMSGTKVIVGQVTGDPRNPIIPLTSQAVTLDVQADVDNLRVGSSVDPAFVVIESGQLAGTVRPKLFVGSDTGVCSVASPNADFTDVTFTNTAFSISQGAGPVDVLVEDAALTATSGTTDAGENLLAGTVRIAGEDQTVPNDQQGLDPEFDAAAFDESWQCNRALAQPVLDTCEEAARATIGTGVSSLTMQTLGTLVSVLDQNAECGFSSAAVGGTPAIGAGQGGQVVATFTLPAGGCALTFPADTLVLTDCLGNTTTISGAVTVTGTKVVTGFATGDPLSPIVPASTDAVSYDLTFVFDETQVETSDSPLSLIIHTGELSALVAPRLAQNPATDLCTIPTPILTFNDVIWTDADVTLVTEDANVRTTIDTSNLDAQSGTGVDRTNTLAGTVRLLGDALDLDGPLDPEFNAEAFSSTWNCAANGSPVLVTDAQCLAGAEAFQPL